MLYWHGEDRDVLTLLRSRVLTREQANYSQILTNNCEITIIYDYFALFKAFNKNTENVHKCIKYKLSSQQPSHTHNTIQNK